MTDDGIESPGTLPVPKGAAPRGGGADQPALGVGAVRGSGSPDGHAGTGVPEAGGGHGVVIGVPTGHHPAGFRVPAGFRFGDGGVAAPNQNRSHA